MFHLKQFPGKFFDFYKCNGKRGNVEINNSSQAGIEPGPLDLKSSTLPIELKSPLHKYSF